MGSALSCWAVACRSKSKPHRASKGGHCGPVSWVIHHQQLQPHVRPRHPSGGGAQLARAVIWNAALTGSRRFPTGCSRLGAPTETLSVKISRASTQCLRLNETGSQL